MIRQPRRTTSYLVFGEGILPIIGLVCWLAGIELPQLPESGSNYPVD